MRKVLAVAAVALALAVPAVGQAQDHNRARTAVQAGEARPLGEIWGALRGRFPGRLLDAQLRQGNTPVYALRILGADGQVRVVSVNARSGQVLSVQGGR